MVRAAVGALLANPSRCRILLALGDGRALAASQLAAEAGVTPATASSHLGKLLASGLLTLERHGRNRYYRLAGHRWADLSRLSLRSPPTSRSVHCGKAPARKHYAMRAPATTISLDASASP